MKEQKTNAMRILDQKRIRYTIHEYNHGDSAVDGLTVARITAQNPDSVFKTLVTKGSSKSNYVFIIPVNKELDLKKAAKAVCEKSIEMIHVSEITPLTGYVRGGCSPVGMKKQFITVFDISVSDLDKIFISAGRIGTQIEISPDDLISFLQGITADITTEE